MKTPHPNRVTGRRTHVAAVVGFTCLIGLVDIIGWSPVGASTVIEQLGGDIDGEATGDYFGWSTSLSADGNTVAIGATDHDASRGHTRIYRWNGANWTQLGGDIDGEAAGDYSGWSTSLSADGNTVAIGAPDNRAFRGHTRIFRWDGANWTQRGADIDGEAAGDNAGLSVSLSDDGNIIAIGAPDNGAFRGHTRIYQWDGSNWTQLGGDIDGEAPGDRFGFSVSLSDDGATVAIGAPENDGDNGANSGHTRIYRWSGSNWTQLGGDIDGEAASDYAGIALSLSGDGNTVAIGASHNNGASGADSGHTRIFRWNGTNWTRLGGDIDGEAAGDFSGDAVALNADGNTVAIGAYLNVGINGAGSGHTRIFRWNGTSWTQRGGDIDGEAANNNSGRSVSLNADGNTVAIGAPGTTAIRGQTRIFRLSTPVVTPAPITPLWRATLDSNGGTCVDVTERTEPWTTAFVGYRYLPGASDCTRPGYTFSGWAHATTPTVAVDLPLLVDPSDGVHRYFVASNLDLVAIWTKNPEPIADVTVFANFLCGPCTTIWLIHPPAEPNTTIDIAIDQQPVECSIDANAFGLTFCQITPLTPGNHTITLTPRNGTVTGPPTRNDVVLNG